MDNLRLILILIGIIILALIVMLHRPAGETRRNHARWRQAHWERKEPRLGGVGESASDIDEDVDASDSQARTASFWNEERAGSTNAPPVGSSRNSENSGVPRAPDKIVYLYICRRDERRINGSDLLDSAIKAGLNFGEMNIFHRRQEGVKQPVFSMANLTKPGYFDPGSWNVFDTPGVTLFLTLPAPVSALDAWDAMHATAQRLSELLEANVLDDGQCLLTRQRIAQIREEMREYDRRNGLVKGNQGGGDGG